MDKILKGMVTQMCGVDVLWSGEQARVMREFGVKLEGGPCPCEAGGRCPLLPATIQLRLREVRQDDPAPFFGSSEG